MTKGVSTAYLNISYRQRKGNDPSGPVSYTHLCFTPELQREALGLVERFYREKGLAVVFSPDKLFFSVKGLEGPGKPGCPAE